MKKLIFVLAFLCGCGSSAVDKPVPTPAPVSAPVVKEISLDERVKFCVLIFESKKLPENKSGDAGHCGTWIKLWTAKYPALKVFSETPTYTGQFTWPNLEDFANKLSKADMKGIDCLERAALWYLRMWYVSGGEGAPLAEREWYKQNLDTLISRTGIKNYNEYNGPDH